MKKFFILMLSAILYGKTALFAMDPPETERYKESYHALPKIGLKTIGDPLRIDNLLALQKLLTSQGNRFQTQDGQVYEINGKEFPAICYLAGEYMPYSSGRADLRRINEMTFFVTKEKDTLISHTYEGRPFESTMVNFKKVDLQEYVKVNWNKNLSFSEIAFFEKLHAKKDVLKQEVSESDDLDSWEDLGSSAFQNPIAGDLSSAQQELPPENLLRSWIPLGSLPLSPELPPEDLLSAQIFYSDSAPQPAGFGELKK